MVATLVRPTRFTDVDLAVTPDDGLRYEIIDGELIVSAAPVKKHQRLSYRITRLIGNHVDDGDLGELYYAPVDVEFLHGVIVQPDHLFIRKDRLWIYRNNTVYGPPDLVVEINSPSTRSRDRTEKFAIYERNLVPEYWQADPDAPSLLMYALDARGRYARIEPVGRTLRSSVLPALVVDIEALFAGL